MKNINNYYIFILGLYIGLLCGSSLESHKKDKLDKTLKYLNDISYKLQCMQIVEKLIDGNSNQKLIKIAEGYILCDKMSVETEKND